MTPWAMASNSRLGRAQSDVFGILTISSDTAELVVKADGGEITVSLPQTFKTELSALNQKVQFHQPSLKFLHSTLSEMGVRLVVELSGRTIAVLGRDSHPGLTSRLLSIAPLQVKLLPLFSAWLSQKTKDKGGL